jgi:hypothetical protein
VETFNALGGPSRVSRSAQMQPLSVPSQITKRKIQSVDFVQVCASSGRPMGLYANDYAFNGDTVAKSRFEIVNLVA